MKIFSIQKHDTIKRAKGFTFVELLVVISIMILLASIILAQTKRARDIAISVKAVQEADRVAEALTIYRNEYGAYPDVSSYGEKNTSYGCEWDTSDHDGDGDGIFFIDPVVEKKWMSNEITTDIGGYPRYLYADDASDFGGCDCLNPGYEGSPVVIVHGLPAVLPGITDSDVCDLGVIWKSSCGGEIHPTIYCKLLPPG